MKVRIVSKLVAAVIAVGSLAIQPVAYAQYPERPVRFVIPFVAGSAPDIMARFYAERLKEELKQPIVVDNKPGATAAIGADLVAKSAADGYTILLNSNTLFINPWFRSQPFDVFKDLVPIIRTAHTPYLVSIRPSLAVNNLAEFIDYARKNPEKLACGTYGIGSPPHLALEMLNNAAGVNIRHIPYKTFGQALPDLMGGQLDCSIDPPTVPLQQVSAGRIRAIAHTGTSANVITGLPQLDPIGKYYPSATVVGWQAIYAPAGIPAPVLAHLRSAWKSVLTDPKIIQKIKEAGFEPLGDSIESFEAAMKSDYQRYGDIIKKNKISP